MLHLASLYPCPCPVALYSIINKCPFGAQTEPVRGSVQGLWTDWQTLKDTGVLTQPSLCLWVRAAFCKNVPKYNSRELHEVLGEDGRERFSK